MRFRSIFNDISDYNFSQFNRSFVDGTDTEYIANTKWHVLSKGVGNGIMIGGYSRNFAMLLNSKYFSYHTDEAYILFIEDHEMFGGVDYVSAMLSHIEQDDIIHNVRGLLFGNYSDNLNQLLLARLKRFGEKYDIPVAYCDDFGHGSNHAVIPIGRRAEFNTVNKTIKYVY